MHARASGNNYNRKIIIEQVERTLYAIIYRTYNYAICIYILYTGPLKNTNVLFII